MPGSLGDLLKQAGLQPSPDAETATPERATSEAPEKPARREARGKVVVRYTRKGHGGKTVTEITGIDTGHSLLLTQLKRELGSGGRVVDDTVVVQGNQVERVARWLESRGVSRVIRG